MLDAEAMAREVSAASMTAEPVWDFAQYDGVRLTFTRGLKRDLEHGPSHGDMTCAGTDVVGDVEVNAAAPEQPDVWPCFVEVLKKGGTFERCPALRT
ncbi:MAG: hypothetical protein AAFV29_27225, partial [Myxococcota bacterium]